MELVTYAIQDTKRYNYDPCKSAVGVMDKWVQTIKKYTGKDAVGNTMQQFVGTHKLG